jgi:hypothetical protein
MQIVSTKICKVSDIGIHNNLFDCTMLSWMDESGRAIAAELACSPNIITLNAGTYWVQWGLTGSATSGPWGVAVTILGQTTTGNGIQAINGGWQDWKDGGTSTGQGGAFIIEGTAGSQPTKDVGVQAILAPNTGVNLTGAEEVKFIIMNYGTEDQSNIPWTVTMTGQGTASFNGTYAGPLAAGATAEITAGTANLSAYGTYNFQACTNLTGDENAANNCKTKAVENKEPSLCIDNLYSTGCYSYGDGLLSRLYPVSGQISPNHSATSIGRSIPYLNINTGKG